MRRRLLTTRRWPSGALVGGLAVRLWRPRPSRDGTSVRTPQTIAANAVEHIAAGNPDARPTLSGMRACDRRYHRSRHRARDGKRIDGAACVVNAPD
jgi:hypothetical protein